jgi:hypothetical protein
MAIIVCSSGSSAALLSCSTYFCKAHSLLIMMSLRFMVAAFVFDTGCSGISFETVSSVLALVRDACAKRDLMMVASCSENNLLAKSFICFIAFAVGAKYISTRCGGKYIRYLNVPIEALSVSSKFLSISPRVDITLP